MRSMITRTKKVAHGIFFLSTIFLATPSYADTLHLKNGLKLHVTILAESEDSFKIATLADTTHDIPKSLVQKRTENPFLLDQLDDKAEALDRKDPQAVYDFALWCRQQERELESYENFQAVIALDPDHAGARKALGYRKNSDGGWHAGWKFRDKFLRYQDALDRQKHGMLNLDGTWVPAAELDVMANGGTLVQGHWLSASQKEQWQRFSDIRIPDKQSKTEKDLGIDLNIAITDLFHIESYFTEDQNRALQTRLTETVQRFLRFMELPPHKRLWAGPIAIYIFETQDQALQYYQYYLEAENPAGMTKLMEENPRTFWYRHPGILMYKFPGATTDMIESEILHIVAHNMLFNFHKKKEIPDWLNEGFAAWMEYEHYKKASGYCYRPSTRITSDGEEGIKHFKGQDWLPWVKTMAKKKKDRPFQDLINASLEDIQLEDLAKSYTLNRFIIESSPRSFRRLIVQFKTQTTPEAAIEKVFNQSPQEFDDMWRKWIRKQRK